MRQKQALTIMMSGANVFLTGAPGAGKTYVLNQFIQRAERAGKKVAVTASTGIAASHLGGMTIHSWSGLGILDSLSSDDLRRLGGSDKLAKRYNAADILVIDEISMLHGSRLDMINRMAKLLRGSDEPFGGLQVILVGDLFQLPPVSRDSREVDFAHLSHAWQELQPKICYITEQHRQSDNDALLVFLEAMRRAEVMDDQFEVITERLNKIPGDDVVVTRLYSHNIDVDSINDRHLQALQNRTYTFEATAKGSKAKREQLMKSLLVSEKLELKIGAEVMFVANNFALGFVNGSRGQVVDINNGTPVVRLINGREIKVEPHTWSLNEDGNVTAEISQLPLRLAWAITIHKSQGMSLDAAEIDLARAFTPGMGYVALSRVRGLDGLYLKGLNNMSFQLHPLIHEFDISLRDQSAELASETDDIGEEEVSAAPVYELDEKLLEKLKAWRLRRAQADGVAAYMVAHNAGLEVIATLKPLTPQQLIALPGFGKSKVEKYGPEILGIVADHEL
jgi:ATP-dependent DNA helicase PIF1